MSERSPYQQRIIKNYYENLPALSLQKLSELVTELYLAEGKQSAKLWERAATTLRKIKLPESRIEHLLTKKDPALLAKLVTELSGRN